MLSAEVSAAQRLVRTDALQMSLGEIVTMYRDRELVVNPNFQRLFRWEISQKSKLIESILLGIPLPPIFVFEQPDGTWELIDGLQRISTILEFMGVLMDENGEAKPPSVLIKTKYLPSLLNAVWEISDAIDDVPPRSQKPIEKEHQLAIRRSRIAVEILKRPSDVATKYDLFQRLNAGGTLANAQELRNCAMIMINSQAFESIKEVAESQTFKDVCSFTPEQIQKQKHLEFATRVLVMANVEYDSDFDVEDFFDQGVLEIFSSRDIKNSITKLQKTFDLLFETEGTNSLKRYDGEKFTGRVGLVGLEGIAVGVLYNLDAILTKRNPSNFIRSKIKTFWASKEADSFVSPGLRGTVRLQRTLPYGKSHFG